LSGKEIRVILIRKLVCRSRYDYVGELTVKEVGGVIDLAGYCFCVGNSCGVEVFATDIFTKEELEKLLKSSKTAPLFNR
jgi:hypothetical protein